jgi:16S rRNA (adenine1518-N6/adenine1519-N6)-dimethyltransferase
MKFHSAVKPKKYLGQHFLKDQEIARKIVASLSSDSSDILEIGPGTGVLTQYIFQRENLKRFFAVDIDTESIEFLKDTHPEWENHIVQGDFLQMDLQAFFPKHFSVIGNFPYNISSSILFRVFELHAVVDEMVGMFQKEVAERIAAKPGNKTYGILSVLLSMFFDIEYLFTVDEHVFNPPPAVKSGVVRLKRNKVSYPDCDEKLFVKVVKTGFNQRRKTLRNALKPMGIVFPEYCNDLLNKRAEQLSVENFVFLTRTIKNL